MEGSWVPWACPETRQRLRQAAEEELKALNERIARGDQVNRGGSGVTEAWTGALVRADGRVAYPVHDGLPSLLSSEGVEL